MFFYSGCHPDKKANKIFSICQEKYQINNNICNYPDLTFEIRKALMINIYERNCFGCEIEIEFESHLINNTDSIIIFLNENTLRFFKNNQKYNISRTYHMFEYRDKEYCFELRSRNQCDCNISIQPRDTVSLYFYSSVGYESIIEYDRNTIKEELNKIINTTSIVYIIDSARISSVEEISSLKTIKTNNYNKNITIEVQN